MSIIVGAALCGRPFFDEDDCVRRAATEGRPYKTGLAVLRFGLKNGVFTTVART
jgi:hypothetical protein